MQLPFLLHLGLLLASRATPTAAGAAAAAKGGRGGVVTRFTHRQSDGIADSDDGTVVAAAAGAKSRAARPCPAAWLAACPDEPCIPLTTPYPEREVMSFHADAPGMSWKYYNLSIITTIIARDSSSDLAALSCHAHKHGVRVVFMLFSDSNHSQLLSNATYQKEYVDRNVQQTVEKYPWIDGVNIDLENFHYPPKNPAALARVICDVQAALRAKGMRLHSQDMPLIPPWHPDFNISALSQCMDFVLPMAYCNLQSTTVAGPTIRLDVLQDLFLRHTYIYKGKPIATPVWEIQPEKIILGLPFFGNNFECNNTAPVPFPVHPPGGGPAPICELTRPSDHQMLDHFASMQIYNSETVTSGPGIGFDAVKASAWFEYTNKTTHRRHQVWFEDPRSVRAKSEFAHTMGMHGVAFWRGNGVYGGRLDRDNVGVDSADARAMWQAAATAGHAGGGYGGRGFHAHEISLSLKAN